mmetsp:Transcript_2912/g.6873  ORF Transcript_2912/g.6873 Transcript_2912/m.6873 type:complete len:478 (-) Transcript_2912:627-2060(-)
MPALFDSSAAGTVRILRGRVFPVGVSGWHVGHSSLGCSGRTARSLPVLGAWIHSRGWRPKATRGLHVGVLGVTHGHGRHGRPAIAIRRRRIGRISVTGSSSHGCGLHGRPLGGEAHFFQPLATQPIALVLSFLCTQSIVQKLFLDLGPLLFGLGQDSIDFFLFFQSSFPRSIILSLSAVFILGKDLHLFLVSFRVWLLFDNRYPFSQLGSPGTRLGVLSGPAIQDVLGRRNPGFDVRLEASRRHCPGNNVLVVSLSSLHHRSSVLAHMLVVRMMFSFSVISASLGWAGWHGSFVRVSRRRRILASHGGIRWGISVGRIAISHVRRRIPGIRWISRVGRISCHVRRHSIGSSFVTTRRRRIPRRGSRPALRRRSTVIPVGWRRRIPVRRRRSSLHIRRHASVRMTIVGRWLLMMWRRMVLRMLRCTMRRRWMSFWRRTLRPGFLFWRHRRRAFTGWWASFFSFSFHVWRFFLNVGTFC